MLRRWERERLGDVLATLPELPAAGELVLTNLGNVDPEEITWLWTGRIPLGKLTLMGGDPGCGKSYVSMALIAAITNGVALPDDEEDRQDPGEALILNYEDGLADTVRPRADLLGVQVRRVTFIERALDEEGRKRQFQLSDVPKLEAVLERNKGIRLLIVDPVMSLIGGSVDAARDNEVRAALAPLVELAARYRVAVLGIMYLRKGEASKALYRISSSVPFGGMARSVSLVAEGADTKRKAIAQVKTNLGAPSEPIEFRIDHLGLTCMGIAPDLSDTALLVASTGETLGGKDEDEEFLRQMLADGPREAKSIQREARREGISERTLARAKATLGVPSRRDLACWWWELLGSHPLLPLNDEVGNVGMVPETPANTPSNQRMPTMPNHALRGASITSERKGGECRFPADSAARGLCFGRRLEEGWGD